MKCATHPDVETNLRCGKCGKPICPKCMVETPVGARCRECARPIRLPTYQVSPAFYLRAVAVALVVAVVCGLVWAAVDIVTPFYVDLLVAPAIGYAMGEAVSFAVNRKRGKGLALVAGLGVVLSYLVAISVPFGGIPIFLFNFLELLSLVLGIYFAANRLR